MRDSRYCQLIGVTAVVVVILVIACSGTPTEQLPPDTDWPVATPESQGLDPSVLNNLTTKLEARELGNISSLLIARNGILVYEQYFNGYTSHDRHRCYSVTKSVTSALIGMAIDDDSITNLTHPILEFFAEYTDIKNPDTSKDSITLEHVLQMRAGFEWDEWSTLYDSPQNPIVHMIVSDDWFKFVLDLPMASDPGSEFTYNSGCTVLLSGVLEKSTGMTAEDYAVANLFEPLGIEDYVWGKGANGITNTGWGLSMRPRDMAKIGQFYLQDGVWGDQRLLSSEWIAESTQRYTTFTNGSGYGYQWWLIATAIDGEDVLIPHADGWGNQYIFYIRPLNMVIVSTAEHYLGQKSHIRTIIENHIFAAVTEPEVSRTY